MKTIAIVNQKGGCGKTTAAVNLAAALAARGRRSLLVDIDPLAHASLALGFVDDGSEKSIYDVLIDSFVPLDDIIRTHSKNLDFAPGIVILRAAEFALYGAPARESRLRDKLARVAPRYDFAVIDCPSAGGLMTINALAAADAAVVPVDSSPFALPGLEQLSEMIDMVRHETHRPLEVRALCSMFDQRTRFASEVFAELRQRFGAKMYATAIRVNVKLREAFQRGQTIFEYAPHSRGAADFAAFADEIALEERFRRPARRIASRGVVARRGITLETIASSGARRHG
ncbi:MAG: ParA family protein [bacterium]